MKNTSTTHSYKILSMVLAIAMIFSMLPVTAFAEAEPDDNTYATSGVTVSGREDEEPPEPPAAHSIVAFAALADSVAVQTVTVDATRADLTLPESLTATVSDGEAESAESIGGVTWKSEPEFEAITVGALEIIPAGTYVFMPTLPEGYALADGVALPVITVEVEPMGIAPAAEWTDWTGATPLTGDITVPTGTTVTVTGALTVSGNVTITGGGTIKRDFSGNLISVPSGASLTLNSIKIDGDKNDKFSDGGGSLVDVNGGTFTMQNGAFLQNNNHHNSSGGGVMVNNSGTFNMEGGTITGNTLNDNYSYGGGGVAVITGTFNMSGTAKITGNTASGSGGNGGGVYLNNGTFNMSGTAEITGNTASGSGGGVHVAYGMFTVGGTAQITGNTNTSGANNVFLSDETYITLGNDLNGADVPNGMNVGVTLWSPPTSGHVAFVNIPMGSAQLPANAFFSDSDLYDVIVVQAGDAFVGTVSLQPAGAPLNATINPTSASFDQNPSASNPVISITLTRNGNTLDKVRVDGVELQAGTYTVGGMGENPVVTFESFYLSTLSVGTHTITLDMNGGTDPTLTLTVIDSTIGPPQSVRPTDESVV